jgi:hypothetical protein
MCLPRQTLQHQFVCQNFGFQGIATMALQSNTLHQHVTDGRKKTQTQTCSCSRTSDTLAPTKPESGFTQSWSSNNGMRTTRARASAVLRKASSKNGGNSDAFTEVYENHDKRAAKTPWRE